jgi:hypothetical protein
MLGLFVELQDGVIGIHIPRRPNAYDVREIRKHFVTDGILVLPLLIL